MQRVGLKFLALALLLAGVSCLKAQNLASITGTVSDPSGAVVPGVHVTLENSSTSVSYSAVTNSVGSYTVANVQPGPGYKVTFTRDGFKPLVITGIYLNVDDTRTQNAKLSLGTTSQTVEVSAERENVTLDTTDATVGNSVEVQQLNELPVQNRDSPTALFYQQPGVTSSGAVTGARSDQTNVTLDGLEVNDNATGQFGAIVGNAPVDSVQEFRGVMAQPLASAGQGGGAQFELVTRSGTNTFHGSLVEYHRDTDTEANDWFNNNARVGRPPLIRNQFGGNVGGPILHDKLFFFFDYNGRRDTHSNLVERTVPLDSYRNGSVSYIGESGNTETLMPSDVAGLDPLHIGFNQKLLSLMNNRYPHANDLTGAAGDLVNTAGYRFNAPFPYHENDYVQRVDFNLNSKMKVFGRGTVDRISGTEGAIQFPGDPATYPFYNQSYAWVAGHTWTLGTNKLNQAEAGETFENYQFPVAYNPQGVNQYSYAGLSGPYGGGNNSQLRTYPIPIIRDDFSWERGRHSLKFGGTFKWETPNEFAAENYNFPSVGVTGNTNFTALTPGLRPMDISSDQYATTIFDDLYTTALGTFASVASNFNYNNKAQVQPQGSGLDLIYRYYETELYFVDTWKVTPSFTISYGVRYQNYTVPYERHGRQAMSNITFDGYWADRIRQSSQGLEGNDVLPFIQYTLGGKVNNAPGYYHAANKNFAPRIGFAYTPDPKTVVRGGAGVVYDHSIINALQFQQLQTSYLFEASNTNLFGTAGDPKSTLETAPRFAGIGSPPSPPDAPSVATPFVPFVSDGVPYGLPYGEFNIVIDPNLKTPYSIEYNFGMQHEFPQGYLLKMDYVGRLGRRLLAEADASQLVEFPDNTGLSTQNMSGAMSGMVTQLRVNAGLGPLGAIFSLGPQPWFEDVIAPGFGAAYGFDNNTQAIAYFTYPYAQRGDFADMMFLLSAFGLLPPNVGMASQFSSNTIWTNKGFSDYNGLLVTLHKNAGYGLQFDLNYTWAHSIDNVSVIANSIAGSNGFGFICDVQRPRECRGNSDFDVTNYITGNFLWDLPIGRGKALAGSAPRWADEAIGGWSLSGLPTWHTGYAYTLYSNAFVAGFANDAAATLIGTPGLLSTKITGGKGSSLNAFANPTTGLAALTGPTGFDIGTRNGFRGPKFFNLDLGVGKNFPLVGDRVSLKFRCDAFNALNHPNFATPSANDITESSGIPFGTITSTVGPPSSDIAARVLQGSLRLEF